MQNSPEMPSNKPVEKALQESGIKPDNQSERLKKYFDLLNGFESAKSHFFESAKSHFLSDRVGDTEKNEIDIDQLEYELYLPRTVKKHPADLSLGYIAEVTDSDFYKQWMALYYSQYEAEQDLASFNFNQGLDLLETGLKKVLSQDEKVSGFTMAQIENLIKNSMTPENIDDFLNSSIEPIANPQIVIEVMNDKFNDAVAVKKLIEHYGGRVNFRSLPISGDKSVFRGYENREEKEMLAVSETLGSLREELGNKISSSKEIDWSDVDESVDFLKNSVENGVIPTNYKEVLATADIGMNYYRSHYSEAAIRRNRDKLAKLEIDIIKKLKIKPEQIKGEGLETLRTQVGNLGYLNGELIGPLTNAEFSDKPTNGEVVAWVVREKIDEDYFRGDQIRFTVYAWRSGLKEPQELFEDHAYSKERSIHVSAPEVTPEGEISVNTIDGNKIFNL